MRFYTISEDYILFLKKTDSRVPNNYAEKRPFVGVVLEVDEHKYLAPLTSHKPKHDAIPSSRESVFKLLDRRDETNKLGMININNMIPVLDSVIREVDFSAQDPKYAALLQLQYRFVKINKEELTKKVTEFYKLIAVEKHEFFSTFSCDFKKLEEVYKSYKEPEV